MKTSPSQYSEQTSKNSMRGTVGTVRANSSQLGSTKTMFGFYGLHMVSHGFTMFHVIFGWLMLSPWYHHRIPRVTLGDLPWTTSPGGQSLRVAKHPTWCAGAVTPHFIMHMWPWQKDRQIRVFHCSPCFTRKRGDLLKIRNQNDNNNSSIINSIEHLKCFACWRVDFEMHDSEMFDKAESFHSTWGQLLNAIHITTNHTDLDLCSWSGHWALPGRFFHGFLAASGAPADFAAMICDPRYPRERWHLGRRPPCCGSPCDPIQSQESRDFEANSSIRWSLVAVWRVHTPYGEEPLLMGKKSYSTWYEKHIVIISGMNQFLIE